MTRSTHHPDYQSFLMLLRVMREDAGLTQSMLAERLGNTQTFVSKVERGERRVDVVEFVELCEALEADPAVALQEYLRRRKAPRPRGRKVPMRPKK